MRSRLNRITDWESLAEAANYSLREMAKRCRVSQRQLERFFIKSKGKSPGEWLHDLRQQRAGELVGKGYSVKEVAFILRFKQASHLSREFKRYYGVSPTGFVAANGDVASR